jgi:TPR repeat protein
MNMPGLERGERARGRLLPHFLPAIILFACSFAQSQENEFQANITEDERARAELLKRRAEQGNAEAQLEISKAFMKGYVFKPNPAEAVKWARAAADQGLAQAQVNLGSFYYVGGGVPQDYIKARSWFQKAADQGNPVAEQNLAVMFANGQGGKQNFTTSMFWFEKAAQQGHPAAAYNLAAAYCNGIGIKKDEVKGYMWHLLALHFGYRLSQNDLKTLDKQMAEPDRIEASRRADEWLRAHPGLKPVSAEP